MADSAPKTLVEKPSSDRIHLTLFGFTQSQLLFTAMELDIFTHIHRGAHSVDALAQQLNLNGHSLETFLHGLVGIGFLMKAEDRTFTLPEDVATYLTKDSESYMGGMAIHCQGLSETWTHLTDVVRTGVPAGGAQGLTEMEAYFAQLVKGLYVTNYPMARELAEWVSAHRSDVLPSSDSSSIQILDAAGGSGVWSIALLEILKEQGAHATVVDTPMVMPVARKTVEQHGLTDRYTFLQANLEHDALPPKAYDIAIAANICQALGEEPSKKLIQKLARSLKPGGALFVVDLVADENRRETGWPLVYGVNMLVLTAEGGVFTPSQFQTWMEAAGLQWETPRTLGNQLTWMTGKRPS